MNNAPVPPLLRFGKALRWHPFAAWMIVGIGMILVAGCLGPKSAPAPIADTSAPAVSTVAEDELLPPVQTNLVDLKTMPRQTFTGLRQNEAPAPAWTLEHYHALGHPVISPDGKWLVITRPGNWFRHGECLVVVDLMNRKVSEHTPPLPGVVGSVVFDREGRNLLGVVNTTGGYSLARWDFPAMSLNLTNLGTGIAIAATLTHAQDRVLVMRDDGIVGVFDATDGAKLLDVGFQKGKPEFYSSALVVTADDAIIISGVVHPANQLVRWRLADGSRVESLPAQQHLAWGRTFATTRDGKTVLGITSFGLAALDSATGESRATYPGNGLYTLHYQPAMDLAAAPIGQGESFGVVDVTTGQLRFWAKHAARPPAPLGYAG